MDFLHNLQSNPALLALGIAFIEVILRLIPTNKNISIIDALEDATALLSKVIGLLVPNRAGRGEVFKKVAGTILDTKTNGAFNKVVDIIKENRKR